MANHQGGEFTLNNRRLKTLNANSNIWVYTDNKGVVQAFPDQYKSLPKLTSEILKVCNVDVKMISQGCRSCKARRRQPHLPSCTNSSKSQTRTASKVVSSKPPLHQRTIQQAFIGKISSGSAAPSSSTSSLTPPLTKPAAQGEVSETMKQDGSKKKKVHLDNDDDTKLQIEQDDGMDVEERGPAESESGESLDDIEKRLKKDSSLARAISDAKVGAARANSMLAAKRSSALPSDNKSRTESSVASAVVETPPSVTPSPSHSGAKDISTSTINESSTSATFSSPVTSSAPPIAFVAASAAVASSNNLMRKELQKDGRKPIPSSGAATSVSPGATTINGKINEVSSGLQWHNEEEEEQESPKLKSIMETAFDFIKHEIREGCFEYAFPPKSKFSEELQFDPALAALSGTLFFVWDPKRILPHLLGNTQIKCPRCPEESRKNLSWDGMSRRIRIERGAIGGANLVCSAAMRCHGCKGASKEGKEVRDSTFSCLDKDILKQFPPQVRAYFPFLNRKNGAIVLCETITSFSFLAERGTSFKAIEESNRTAITQRFANFENRRKQLFEQAKLSIKEQLGAGKVPDKLPDGSVLDYVKDFVLTAGVAIKIYITEYARQFPILQASFLNAILVSPSLHIDMCFPWGNDGSDSGQTGLWVVLNCYGEVVAAQAAVSKSPDDAIKMLRAIRKHADAHNHKIKVIFTDNPIIDASALREVFGQDIYIAKDLFHIVSALFDCVGKTQKLRPHWESAVVNSFWSFVEEDVKLERDRLIASGWPLEKVEFFMKQPSFLKSRQAIRHVLRPVGHIRDMLDAALIVFSTKKVLTLTAWEARQPIFLCIEEYLKLPTGFELPRNVGTADRPIWRYMQGTSMVELFNRFCNELNLERFSPEGAEALLARVAFTFSHTQRINFRLQPLLLYLRDPTLQNDFIALERRFKSKEWLRASSESFAGIEPIVPLKSDPDSEGLVNLKKPLGSYSLSALEYLKTGSHENISKRVPLSSFAKDLVVKDLVLRKSRADDPSRPFETDEERDLLTEMIKEKAYLTNAGQERLFKNDQFDLHEFFASVSRGALDELFVINKMCFDWNIQFLIMHEYAILSYKHLRLDSEKITPKEPVHFKNEFERRSKIASKKLLDAPIKSLLNDVALVSSTQAPSSSGPILDATPAVVGFQSIPPAILPNVVPASINQLVPPLKPRPIGVPKQSETSKGQTRKKKDPFCVECKCHANHVSLDPCPFFRWMTEFPKVPLQGYETSRQAHDRIWKQCRLNFVADDGTYKKPNHPCNFLGNLLD